MKKILLVTALAAAGLIAGNAHALTSITGTFNVNINLTSRCLLTAPADLAFTYTSFQAAAAAATGGAYSVQCTKDLPYTMSLDQTTVTDAAVGLQYTVTVPATGTGSGVAQNLNVSGNITANQGGTCSVATCDNSLSNNKLRTLTLSF